MRVRFGSSIRRHSRGDTARVSLAVLGVFASLACLTAAGPPATKSADPHWQPDGCNSCHQAKIGQPPRAIAAARAGAICLDCHDGQRAHAESHPIGGVFTPDEYIRPEGWPLVDGKLGCLTCHDPLLACDPSARRSPSNPAFLRGPNVHDLQLFCANCHRRPPYKMFDPHRMVTEGNLVRQEVCLFCHTRMLDRNAMRRVGKPALRTNQLSLCTGCHTSHIDYFEPGHIGRLVPKDILAYMAAVENAGPTSRPSRELVEHMIAQGAKPKSIVLDPTGRIVCTTCHNPHKSGLFPPDSELGRGAIRMKGKERLTPPPRNQRLCFNCHDI